MKRLSAGLLILIALVVVSAPIIGNAAPPPPPLPEPITIPLDSPTGQAILAALEQRPAPGAKLAPDANEVETEVNGLFSSVDGNTALAWITPLDPETGEPMGTEPRLSILQANQGMHSLAETWQVTQFGDPGWAEALQSLPKELIPFGPHGGPEAVDQPQAVEKAVGGTIFGGYYLPWAKGLTKKLSQGPYHPTCSNPYQCRYAYDFYDGTMFPMLAAKGGTVFHFKDTCPNDADNCTNSITIQDKSTTPTTYQIYLHMRQGSIPDKLKSIGAPVNQGEYIGDVDNTGYSSGHHVHFMVVTNPVLGYSGYIWGQSVEITFKDVAINWDAGTQGGRPCVWDDVKAGYCSEYTNSYTSGNQGSNPPTGDLTFPGDFLTITNPVQNFTGWGSDDRQVVKMQILANAGSGWVEVGQPAAASPFVTNVDFCQTNLPNGPLDLGLRVWDYEGNQSPILGVRRAFKSTTCAPTAPPPPPNPSCMPNENQVALYSEPLLGGACQVFGEGSYNANQLGQVGDNNTASLILGKNVSVTLFDGNTTTGRAETFTSIWEQPTLYERNLSDNLIGPDSTSSIQVRRRDIDPNPPVLQAVGAPSSQDSITLAWTNTGGATKFEAQLYSGSAASGTPLKTMGTAEVYSWPIGSLPPGTYTWQVRGRVTKINAAGNGYEPTYRYSSWVAQTFTVSAGAATAETYSQPYTASFEDGASGWSAAGMWRLTNLLGSNQAATNAWTFNNGSTYADGGAPRGDLTSPLIQLPASPAAYLRFAYQYQTESPLRHFDQRQVQIAVAGGDFEPLLTLQDDPMGQWLRSADISLARYAGKAIRIRFHFNTIDANLNGYSGWTVDDVSVSTTPPPACAETAGNDTFTTAASLSIGGTANGVICPAGDVDYFKFTGTKGDWIRAEITAKRLATPSSLDSHLALLDSDGNSVLAENDDIEALVNQDSRVVFTLPASGTYYLKVKAWDHPGAGSTNSTYKLALARQSVSPHYPIVAFSQQTGSYVMGTPFQLMTVAAPAADGGIQQVEFLYHSPDWTNGTWQTLGFDRNGSDGWSYPFNPAGHSPDQAFALATRVWDWNGNTAAVVAWQLRVDTTPPTSALNPLQPAYNSSAVQLSWTASDNGALGSYRLFVSENGGEWTTISIPGTRTDYWFVGRSGSSYAFRLQAVDIAGNWEVLSQQAETSTTLQVNCAAAPDAYEAADSSTPANLTLGGAAIQRNFCGLGDVDTFTFQAQAGQKLAILTFPTPGSPAGSQITVLDAGSNPIATSRAEGLGQFTGLYWEVGATGTYQVKIQSIDAGVAGAPYLVSFSFDYRRFLPTIWR